MYVLVTIVTMETSHRKVKRSMDQNLEYLEKVATRLKKKIKVSGWGGKVGQKVKGIIVFPEYLFRLHDKSDKPS